MTAEQRKNSDLFVLSDLHLGEGMSRDEPRYLPTEDFFHDAQFARFLNHIRERYAADPSGATLILNGDTFDFLTVTTVPGPASAEGRGFRVTNAEQKFGLNPTEKKSIYKLDLILAGHEPFFRTLAEFVGDGFSVHIIRGNHDLELYFEGVRLRLKEHLTLLDPRLTMTAVDERVHFHDWFYMEPDRVYIEHGNQYDPSNSIRYPLMPVLSEKQRDAMETEETLDYPLGSIFVRFFYNRVRQLDPYSPRIVSFDHYLSFVKRYNLFDVWKIYKSHYPHFIAALGGGATTGSSGSSHEADERQRQAFSTMSAADPVPELYVQLSALKNSPVSASKANVVKEMISAVIRRMRNFGILAFIAIFAWFGILYLIDLVPGLTASAFLMAIFAVATLGGVLTVWIQLDRKLRRRDSLASESQLVAKAEAIAAITRSPIVLMGHTHMVEYRRIRHGQAVYANSGTWTSIDNPWSRFMRDARRLTFLLVQDRQVRLLRWNDDADRLDPVPLFQLSPREPLDRLPSETALNLGAGRRNTLPPHRRRAVDDDTLTNIDLPGDSP